MVILLIVVLILAFVLYLPIIFQNFALKLCLTSSIFKSCHSLTPFTYRYYPTFRRFTHVSPPCESESASKPFQICINQPSLLVARSLATCRHGLQAGHRSSGGRNRQPHHCGDTQPRRQQQISRHLHHPVHAGGLSLASERQPLRSVVVNLVSGFGISSFWPVLFLSFFLFF